MAALLLSIFLDFVPWLLLLGFTLFVLITAMKRFREDQHYYRKLYKQTWGKHYLFVLFPSFVLVSRFFVQLKRAIDLDHTYDDQTDWMDYLGFCLCLLQGVVDSVIYLVLYKYYIKRFQETGASHTSSLIKTNVDFTPEESHII